MVFEQCGVFFFFSKKVVGKVFFYNIDFNVLVTNGGSCTLRIFFCSELL